ncbi:hypothetical protein ACFL4K_00095 [Candidatus Neomarinimicrobiota bacterium]
MMLQILVFVKSYYEIISIIVAIALLLVTLWFVMRSKGSRSPHIIPAQDPGFYKIQDFSIVEGDPIGLEINMLNDGDKTVLMASLIFALVSESIIEMRGKRKTELLIEYSEKFNRVNPIGGGQYWKIQTPSVECKRRNMPILLQRYAIARVCYKGRNSLISRTHKYFWELGEWGRFEEPSSEIQRSLKKMRI